LKLKKNINKIEKDFRGFEWMTSPITEIISETEFKTKNSHYIIEKC